MDYEFVSSLRDPNGALTPEDLMWSQNVAGGAFHRCDINHELIVRDNCQSMVLGRMKDKAYLVYGRLTHSEDEETGTGAIPQILIDTALEMKAEPYVVRINV